MKILCLIGLHDWRYYLYFLSRENWHLVDWGAQPEWWCPTCGAEKKKNTLEVIEI